MTNMPSPLSALDHRVARRKPETLRRSGKCSWACQFSKSARTFGAISHHIAKTAVPRTATVAASNMLWGRSQSADEHVSACELTESFLQQTSGDPPGPGRRRTREPGGK